MKHVAHQYALDVRSGKIIAGELIKKAVERYFNDLDTQLSRGLYFNEKKASRACRFFPTFLRHSKGKWAGKPFNLEPWQAFIVWNIFGWYNANGTRRFNTAYIEVARKNGKSTLAAGIGLFMMVADGEIGAEIYVGATKLPQAKITFNEAKNMVNSSPQLKQMLTVYQHNIHSIELAAKFEAIASDSDKQDGLNPHNAIIDEYHAHKDSSLYNVLESGMGARENPLMFVITTAGFNKFGPSYQQRTTCVKILDGVIEQDDMFCMIFSPDKEDDWEDETTWYKGNPSIEAIDTIMPFLEKQYKSAKNDPSKQVNFLTKNLNIWTDASDVWIEDKRWMECNLKTQKWEEFEGRTCYGALDLSSTEDISSFSLFFPGSDYHDVFRFFIIPEETVRQRTKSDGVPYEMWVNQGLLEVTPGDTIDYDYIRMRITGYYVLDGKVMHDENCIMDKVNLISVAYDRWNSSQIVNNLQADGLKLSQFGQGFASMSTPTKQYKTFIFQKKLNHGGNPVLRWMVSNVEIKKDPAGNEKPDKGKSKEKIDGIVSDIMALGEWLTAEAESGGEVYEVLTV